MHAAELVAQIRQQVANDEGVVVTSQPLKYRGGNFEFLRIAHRDIGPQDRVMLITAGVHGEEVAGPHTMAKHLREIFRWAEQRELKLIVYPLYNPSGYDINKRHNIDNDTGDNGNLDFIRYESPDGALVDDLGARGEYLEWYWASDPIFGVHLAVETQAAHEILKREPLKQIVVTLDLHQDFISPGFAAAAYHYAFGDLTAYWPIVDRVAKIVPLLTNLDITGGFQPEDGAGGYQANPHNLTDERGFIVRHDGSLPDLMWRLGVKHAVTVETSGATPPDDAIKVNLIWIEGLMDLVAPSPEPAIVDAAPAP